MLKVLLVLALAPASLLLSQPAQFADSVISYDPGAGFAPGFTNSAAALGEPSRSNPFGDTDPFDPPYGKAQIVSIGAGGHLVLQFHTPILNHPNNLYGYDFTIFGNAGFIITNDFDLTTYDWIGIPATDGSLFGSSAGQSLISVSRDGINFFQLDSAKAPPVDSFPPTDGSGNFQVPLDPQLTQTDFAGGTLERIRALYNGSGGGASYDISWAQDAAGNSVFLPEINFVRIDVLSGRAEIDGVASVLRAPASGRRD